MPLRLFNRKDTCAALLLVRRLFLKSLKTAEHKQALSLFTLNSRSEYNKQKSYLRLDENVCAVIGAGAREVRGIGRIEMAKGSKAATILIKLLSTAGTGYF